MFNGNKSLFANQEVEIPPMIERNDIYNSSFIANMMHDKPNMSLEEVIETDTRLDIFATRVAPKLDESIIQLVNKIVSWNDVKVGDKLYVPTEAQLSSYSVKK